MPTPPIYMDAHATTPVDPRVFEAMRPYFTERFGNASSRSHAFGWTAGKAVEAAREQVAALIGAKGRDILFTAGATESNNLALKGAARAARGRGDHIVTAATEHHAVLDTCRRLAQEGFRITVLPVDGDGLLDPDAVARAMTGRTILVSVMAASNEIGVLQPIAEIGRIARERGVLFHTDAAQAAGKVPLDVEAQHVDLLSIAAHKMYGPKGVGALYVRRRQPRVQLEPLIDGGGQERGLRPGTLNVPGIVGLGAAAEICRREMDEEAVRLRGLRDRLHDGLRRRLPGVRTNGSMVHRLPHSLNISFDGVDGDALLTALGDVAVSSGSACTSGTIEPSYVLRALGLSDELARASIRFGLGRFNTEAEVDYVVDRVAAVVGRLRRMAPAAAAPPAVS